MKPVSYTMLLLSFFTQSTTDSVYLRVPRIPIEPIHHAENETLGLRTRAGLYEARYFAKRQNSGHDCRFPDYVAGSSARRFGGL